MKRKINARKGETYEIILSTYDDHGRPNAAPMGIKFVSQNRIRIQFFKGSQTLHNVLARNCAVANLTGDASLFYRLAFKSKTGVSAVLFSQAKVVNAPLLKQADGYIEMSFIRDIQHRDRTFVDFNIKRTSWRYVAPALYSRGAHALVEATIHSTRIHQFLVEGKKVEAAKLIYVVKYYKDLVKRVSPNSDYAKNIKELQSKIIGWKRNQSIRQNPL